MDSQQHVKNGCPGRWEGGSRLGTHVHLWLIHVKVWQNQYSIVKQNKVKKKKGCPALLLTGMPIPDESICLRTKFPPLPPPSPWNAPDYKVQGADVHKNHPGKGGFPPMDMGGCPSQSHQTHRESFTGTRETRAIYPARGPAWRLQHQNSTVLHPPSQLPSISCSSPHCL